jgi:hypothetical protein
MSSFMLPKVCCGVSCLFADVRLPSSVVVATGIVALVDNAIRATFHTPPHVLELQAGKVRAGNESLDAESEPLTPL